MPHIHCVSVSKEVSDALDKLYHGQKSKVVDAACRAYFELNPEIIKTRERRIGVESYPPAEITVEDL